MERDYAAFVVGVIIVIRIPADAELHDALFWAVRFKNHKAGAFYVDAVDYRVDLQGEGDLRFRCIDVDYAPFQVVIQPGEACGAVKQHRVTDFIGVHIPPDGGIRVVVLQEPVYVVDSVQPVVVEAQYNLVGVRFDENRFVKAVGKVPFYKEFGYIVGIIPDFAPYVEQIRPGGAIHVCKFYFYRR